MTPVAAPRLPSLLVLPLLGALLLAGCTGDDVARTTLEVRFLGAGEDITVEVRHLDARPTGAMYGRDGVPHPGYYTAHDQLEAWSRQTGTPYATTSYPDAGFGAGYFLTAIDGVVADGSSAYWSLSINGEASLVGMAQAEVKDGDTVTWERKAIDEDASAATDPAAGPSAPSPSPALPVTATAGDLQLTIDAAPPTKEPGVLLGGTVSRDAQVSILDGPSVAARAGRWAMSLPLEYGQTSVSILADDGAATARVDLVLVRLAPATLSAEFPTAVPPREPIQDEVWFDVDAFLSQPMYDAAGVQHPPHANIHDAMLAWGRDVEFSGPGAFGFGVESIEGHGYFSDWCYDVNGASAPLGITDMEFHPGDAIAWHACIVA